MSAPPLTLVAVILVCGSGLSNLSAQAPVDPNANLRTRALYTWLLNLGSGGTVSANRLVMGQTVSPDGAPVNFLRLRITTR